MTFPGPPYPPAPLSGSNAIGSFEIGVSPIGTIPPFNPWTTVITQYADSPVIDGLVLSFNAAQDQTLNFDNFYDNQWSPDTAIGYGLDVIGRIVGVTRTIQIPGTVTYFGFEEGAGQPFGQGAFYSGETLSTSFSLSDPAFRTLIYAKMLSNITDGSIQDINKILLTLFPHQGNCYVVDGLNMTMQYVFEFQLTQVQLAIIEQSGVLPLPVGVVATIVQS